MAYDLDITTGFLKDLAEETVSSSENEELVKRAELILEAMKEGKDITLISTHK